MYKKKVLYILHVNRAVGTAPVITVLTVALFILKYIATYDSLIKYSSYSWGSTMRTERIVFACAPPC